MFYKRAFERSEQEHARERRAWERERRELLDRLMYLSGHTWEPPPERPELEEDLDWGPDLIYPEQMVVE